MSMCTVWVMGLTHGLQVTWLSATGLKPSRHRHCYWNCWAKPRPIHTDLLHIHSGDETHRASAHVHACVWILDTKPLHMLPHFTQFFFCSCSVLCCYYICHFFLLSFFSVSCTPISTHTQTVPLYQYAPRWNVFLNKEIYNVQIPGGPLPNMSPCIF